MAYLSEPCQEDMNRDVVASTRHPAPPSSPLYPSRRPGVGTGRRCAGWPRGRRSCRPVRREAGAWGGANRARGAPEGRRRVVVRACGVVERVCPHCGGGGRQNWWVCMCGWVTFGHSTFKKCSFPSLIGFFLLASICSPLLRPNMRVAPQAQDCMEHELDTPLLDVVRPAAPRGTDFSSHGDWEVVVNGRLWPRGELCPSA